MFKKLTTVLGILAFSVVLVGQGCSQQTQMDSSTTTEQEQQQEAEQQDSEQSETDQEDNSEENKETKTEAEMEAEVESETEASMGGEESSSDEEKNEVMMEGETSADIEASSETEGEMDSEADTKVVNVSGGEFYFDPSKIRVKEGQKVKVNFKNTGNIAHNLKIPSLGVGSQSIQGGESSSFTFTAEEKGSYPIEFECTIPGHADQGMAGEIIVE